MGASPFILCASVFAVYATLSPYLSVLTRSLGFSPAVTGIIMGAAEISGIAAPFFFSSVSDKRGDYRLTLAAALALAIVSGASIFFLRSPAVCALFALLLTAGLRSAIPLSDAVITVNLRQDGNYGMIRALGSLSFVLIVLFLQLSPVLRPSNAANIAFWSMCASALTLFVVFALPKQYFDTRKRAENVKTAPNPFPNKEKFVWTPVFILGIVVIFLNRLAFSPIQSYIALYATEYLHWDAVGLLSAVSAAAELPFVFISSRLIKRYGAQRLIAATTAVVGLRLLLIALFPARGILLASQLLHSFTFGIFHPAAVAFVTMNVPPQKRAAGMAIYMSLGTGLSTFTGNIAGGFIIEKAGYRALYGSFVIFAAAALVLYIAAGRKIWKKAPAGG